MALTLATGLFIAEGLFVVVLVGALVGPLEIPDFAAAGDLIIAGFPTFHEPLRRFDHIFPRKFVLFERGQFLQCVSELISTKDQYRLCVRGTFGSGRRICGPAGVLPNTEMLRKQVPEIKRRLCQHNILYISVSTWGVQC